MRTILDSSAIGIERKKRNHFFTIEKGSKYASIDPRAKNAIKERKPEQGFPTRRWPAGIKILNPSRWIGIPTMLVIHTPALAAKILSGKEISPITASGNGNINIKKMRGKIIILVMFFPKRKKDVPKTRKKIEKPDIEKTYSIVPAI